MRPEYPSKQRAAQTCNTAVELTVSIHLSALLPRHTLATYTDVKFILGRSAREAKMKRNRIAVGHLATAHSFLVRVCRDEKCLAGVRPKMIEKLQNCARQWHDAVASTAKRDKMRAVTIKMRDHSLANEAELANAARHELEQLRATKIGEFDPKFLINDTSTLEDIKQAIQVCADMIAEAVRAFCFATIILLVATVCRNRCLVMFLRSTIVGAFHVQSAYIYAPPVYRYQLAGDRTAKRGALDGSVFGELGKEVVDNVSLAVRNSRLFSYRHLSYVRSRFCGHACKRRGVCSVRLGYLRVAACV